MALSTINRTLLPLKAACFFYFFSFFSIVPFIQVFLRQIGLDAKQAGITAGLRMFIQCLTGPLWGIIADKKQRHRSLLLTQIICSSCPVLLAPWIPKIVPRNVHELYIETEKTQLRTGITEVTTIRSSQMFTALFWGFRTKLAR